MDRMLPATAVEADVFSFADDLPKSMHVAIGSKDRGRILQWDHAGPSSSMTAFRFGSRSRFSQ